jgi:dCTP diphosphatase
MSVEDLQKSVRDFAEERDWTQFHSPRNLILAIQGELGELAEIVQWCEDSAMTEEWVQQHREPLEQEIADIFIYVLRLCDVLGIDLAASTVAKLKVNAAKYPVELAKGSATKYSHFGGD